MTADPDLWRASVTTAGFAMPEVPEAIEDEALSVSMFEIEDEATADPIGWQVDILFRNPPDPDQLAIGLAPSLAAAAASLERITVERVSPEEWARATELRLPPVTAGRFVVHGSHARALVSAGAVPIEIDAGLAFGSGEHATTCSCLVAIDRLARQRRFVRVLDVGCGCWRSPRPSAGRPGCSRSTTTPSPCGSPGAMPSSTASAGGYGPSLPMAMRTRSSVAAAPTT